MVSKAPNLTLFRDRDDPGEYTWSPFVVKLEARLRFSHLSYTTQAGTLAASPKGKLPYVRIEEDNGQSTVLSDTELITKSLIKSGSIKDLNANLTPAQAATDLAIRALLEDKLYFLNGHERWITNFYTMRDFGPLSTIPYLPRLLV
ncbi:hypothetical protein V491_09133, partial [Pseudogymnoascus sp. VKM F-3775]